MLHTRVIRLEDGFSFLSISPRLAVMYRALKRPGKGGRLDRIQCAYFGFETEQQAIDFAQYAATLHKFSKQQQPIARPSERLNTPYEVKVWEFEQVIDLVYRCANKAQKQQAAAA